MTDPKPAAYSGPTRVLSGIQASGALHLGNYLGALKRFVAVAGKHAIPAFCLWRICTPSPSGRIRRVLADQTREIAAAYLASGLDPETLHHLASIGRPGNMPNWPGSLTARRASAGSIG